MLAVAVGCIQQPPLDLEDEDLLDAGSLWAFGSCTTWLPLMPYRFCNYDMEGFRKDQSESLGELVSVFWGHWRHWMFGQVEQVFPGMPDCTTALFRLGPFPWQDISVEEKFEALKLRGGNWWRNGCKS